VRLHINEAQIIRGKKRVMNLIRITGDYLRRHTLTKFRHTLMCISPVIRYGNSQHKKFLERDCVFYGMHLISTCSHQLTFLDTLPLVCWFKTVRVPRFLLSL